MLNTVASTADQNPTAFADVEISRRPFRWLPKESSDTARYLYASILRAVDSGLVIRLEHETSSPKKR
jgi:hypothetical protein